MKRSRTKRRLRRLAIFVTIAVALAIVAVASLAIPYQGFQGPTFVKLDYGAGTPALARALEQAGIIRYGWQFVLARAIAPSAKLQAGEYRFTGPASVLDVFHRIAAGDVYYFDFSVPEGSNMFDIARLLDASGAMRGEDFLRAAADPTPIQDLDAHAPTLEGYLFPSTYRLSHSTTAAELCEMMTAQFRKQWKRLTSGSGIEPHRTITLASLVEKETGVPEERPLIAGVFVNRLKRGMNLDCDPTAIYAALLQHHYSGVIHRSDLARESPYNTYKNPGLPPGPVANPGAASIAATLHPAETNYIYFVAKPSGGGHQFSASPEAHEKAVRAYRNGLAKARKAG